MNDSRLLDVTRRHFFSTTATGIGAAALGSLLNANTSGAAGFPNFAPKAKRVIYLYMSGGPSQFETFDDKPMLRKLHGKPMPSSLTDGVKLAFLQYEALKCFGSDVGFKRCGESGQRISNLLPNLQDVADELCVIKSMHTDQFNHAPAELLIYTGSPRPGRPSIGSWATYGLGTENQNLPGFVVLISSGVQPNGGRNSYGSGFLPSVYQGVQCRSKGDPVLFASDPAGLPRDLRRKSLDTLNALNAMQADELGHPETLTRMSQYELAFRMQTSVPDVMDISKEKQTTLEDYGAEAGAASFANNCLLARRLVEQGVRYVQLFDWGWDFHGTGPNEDIRDGLTRKCATMEKPVAALIRDLKQRGMLDETLIVLGGEFGRTPFREGRTAKGNILGRDHFPDCYSMMLAGGGIKGGMMYGASDELGFSVAENPVHVHDLQATILNQLGFNHERLTFRFQGRDYRLTDVAGEVVKPILA